MGSPSEGRRGRDSPRSRVQSETARDLSHSPRMLCVDAHVQRSSASSLLHCSSSIPHFSALLRIIAVARQNCSYRLLRKHSHCKIVRCSPFAASPLPIRCLATLDPRCSSSSSPPFSRVCAAAPRLIRDSLLSATDQITPLPLLPAFLPRVFGFYSLPVTPCPCLPYRGPPHSPPYYILLVLANYPATSLSLDISPSNFFQNDSSNCSHVAKQNQQASLVCQDAPIAPPDLTTKPPGPTGQFSKRRPVKTYIVASLQLNWHRVQGAI